MSAYSFAVAYYFAHILAAPISALIIGASVNEAYCLRLSRIFRWGTKAMAFFCLIFIATVVREIYTVIEQESEPLENTLVKRTPWQILMPITVGAVEFLIQGYNCKLLIKPKGIPKLAIICIPLCCLNFLVSWACAIDILFQLKPPQKEQINHAVWYLPTFKIGMKNFITWQTGSMFAASAILASRLYSSRQARLIDEGGKIQFFRNDNTITKLGVISLQTTALSAALNVTISFLFFIIGCTQVKPTSCQVGCFTFLNLMRVPVSCATWVFTMQRQDKSDSDAIGMSSEGGNSMDEISLKENHPNVSKNQVNVHTVSCQVNES